MCFTLATAALFAASASAFTLSNRVNSASCRSTVCDIPNDILGNCASATNTTCLCHNQAFINIIVGCYEQSCDLASAEESARSFCSSAGVSLSPFPTIPPTTRSTSSPTTTSQGSSSNPNATLLSASGAPSGTISSTVADSSPGTSAPTSGGPVSNQSTTVLSGGASPSNTDSPTSNGSDIANGRSTAAIWAVVGGLVGFLVLVGI